MKRETGSAVFNFIFCLFALVVVVGCIASVVGQILQLVDIIPVYLTDPVKALLEPPKEMWNGLLQGWGLVSVPMVFAGKLLCSAIGVSAVIVIATVSWSFVSRRKKPTVFISYHHSKIDFVIELVAMIGDDDLRLEYIPFTTAPLHNQLLDEIHASINKCDIVLCIPGAEPSFVQNEVFAAVQMKKPLIFLVEYNTGKLPDTAQKSYPVFKLGKVRARSYESVRLLMLYLYGDWRSTLKLLFMSHEPAPAVLKIANVLSVPVVVCLFVVFVFLILCALVAFIVWYFVSFEAQGVFFGGLIAILLCVFTLFAVVIIISYLGNYISGLIRWRVSNAVISRRVKTGEYAYALLRPVFNPKNPMVDFGVDRQKKSQAGRWLLASLWRTPPAAHYQATLSSVQS